ncbi:MAG: DUF2277 domain-containing protein, partial [Chloroflexota bacterium]
MCRSITTLRGLVPPATAEEVDAAALQYVRKVAGIATPSAATGPAVDRAVAEIAAATARLLAELPPRRTPPGTVPPLRRPAGRAREPDRAPHPAGAGSTRPHPPHPDSP